MEGIWKCFDKTSTEESSDAFMIIFSDYYCPQEKENEPSVANNIVRTLDMS